MRHCTILALAGAATLAAMGPTAVQAAEFHLMLRCEGKLLADGKSKAATLDMALRDNNETALIQRSNVLPVGERLRYKASPMAYSMVYKLPPPGSVYYHDWLNGHWVVWHTSLKRLAAIRLSIDRQSAELEGELLDHHDEQLGTIAMACTPNKPEDLPEPKF